MKSVINLKLLATVQGVDVHLMQQDNVKRFPSFDHSNYSISSGRLRIIFTISLFENEIINLYFQVYNMFKLWLLAALLIHCLFCLNAYATTGIMCICYVLHVLAFEKDFASRDVEAFASIDKFIETSGGDSADNISWILYGFWWRQSST